MGKMGKQGSYKQKWIPKGEAREDDDGEAEATGDPSAGPVYDKVTMLQVLRLCKQEAACGSADSPAGRLFAKERPAPEESAVSRRAPREQKEKQKKAAELDVTAQLSDPAQEGTAGINAFIAQYLTNMTMAANIQPVYNSGYNTTVMLRNIPNRYTRDMLIEQLDKGFEKQYDFVYLPIDFNSKCNVGYAFINFRTPPAAARFIREYHNAKTKQVLPGFGSNKVCEVAYARVQGRDANMENLRDEKFIEKLQERLEWQPLFYDENHEEIPFSKTLGAGGGKKRGSRSGSSFSMPAASPTNAPTPSGFMMPTPFGPMMYPGMSPFGMPPAAPPVTLASVLPDATAETMVRLKGIPASWNTKRILEFFSGSFKGSYDFMFVPPDPKGESKNRGYCFVNFRTVAAVKQFMEECHEKPATGVFGEDAAADQACQGEPGRFPNIEKSIIRAQALAKDGKGGASETGEGPLLLVDSDGNIQPFPNLGQTPGMDMGQAEARSTPKGGSKGGKGGKGGKGAASPTAAGMMGFPGFLPTPTAGSSPQQQQSAAAAAFHAYRSAAFAMQAQHFHAAAAALHANEQYAKGGKGKSKSKDRGRALAAPEKAALRAQLEFYFSTDNLCKDFFLRKHMDNDGWVSLELIATFKRVSAAKATVEELADIVATSDVVETDSAKCQVRLKDEALRVKWVKASEAPAS